MEELNGKKKYILIIVFMFLTLPICLMFLKEGMKESLIFGYLYALNPIVIFVVSLMYAVKCGPDWKYPVIVGALFIPAAVIYFGLKNLVFVITYAVFSFVGVGIGALLKRFF